MTAIAGGLTIRNQETYEVNGRTFLLTLMKSETAWNSSGLVHTAVGDQILEISFEVSSYTSACPEVSMSDLYLLADMVEIHSPGN